jgi:hypothetical protein
VEGSDGVPDEREGVASSVVVGNGRYPKGRSGTFAASVLLWVAEGLMLKEVSLLGSNGVARWVGDVSHWAFQKGSLYSDERGMLGTPSGRLVSPVWSCFRPEGVGRVLPGPSADEADAIGD